MNEAKRAKLRIAIFTTAFPASVLAGSDERRPAPLMGGVERVVAALVAGLEARGHDIVVHTTGPRKATHLLGGVEVRAYAGMAKIGQTAIAPGLLRAHSDQRPDIVLAMMGAQPAPSAAARYARRTDAPLLISFHRGTPIFDRRPIRSIAMTVDDRLLSRRVINQAASVVALSDQHIAASRLLASNRGKIQVIPNGVDRPPSVPSWQEARQALGLGAEPTAIIVSSLVPRKGVGTGIRAIAETERPWHLRIIGTGPLRAKLEAMVEDLGITDRVVFEGRVSEARKHLLLAAADAFLFPTLAEAYPLVVLEAGCFGLPVIASRLPEMAAVVQPGTTGLLAHPQNPSEFAKHLDTLVSDGELRDRLGRAGAIFAAEHDWDHVVTSYEELMHGLLTGGV